MTEQIVLQRRPGHAYAKVLHICYALGNQDESHSGSVALARPLEDAALMPRAVQGNRGHQAGSTGAKNRDIHKFQSMNSVQRKYVPSCLGQD